MSQRESGERDCCRLCVYHKPKGDRCRRYPPGMVYDIKELQIVTRYPHVNPSMWCGEFKDWAVHGDVAGAEDLADA